MPPSFCMALVWHRGIVVHPNKEVVQHGLQVRACGDKSWRIRAGIKWSMRCMLGWHMRWAQRDKGARIWSRGGEALGLARRGLALGKQAVRAEAGEPGQAGVGPHACWAACAGLEGLTGCSCWATFFFFSLFVD
ncbi:unnamed protein product [Prunus armeniaca]